jgi:hypothetical protein
VTTTISLTPTATSDTMVQPRHLKGRRRELASSTLQASPWLRSRLPASLLYIPEQVCCPIPSTRSRILSGLNNVEHPEYCGRLDDLRRADADAVIQLQFDVRGRVRNYGVDDRDSIESIADWVITKALLGLQPGHPGGFVVGPDNCVHKWVGGIVDKEVKEFRRTQQSGADSIRRNCDNWAGKLNTKLEPTMPLAAPQFAQVMASYRSQAQAYIHGDEAWGRESLDDFLTRLVDEPTAPDGVKKCIVKLQTYIGEYRDIIRKPPPGILPTGFDEDEIPGAGLGIMHVSEDSKQTSSIDTALAPDEVVEQKVALLQTLSDAIQMVTETGLEGQELLALLERWLWALGDEAATEEALKELDKYIDSRQKATPEWDLLVETFRPMAVALGYVSPSRVPRSDDTHALSISSSSSEISARTLDD